MIAKVDHRTKLKDLQKQFNKKFPYLKIEFFSRPFTDDGFAPGKYQVDNEAFINEIALKKPGVKIAFSPDETVIDIERKLREDFGLFAHVFRKSGHVWVQTTSTNHWTLLHQNEHAQEGAKYKPRANIFNSGEDESRF